MARTEMVRRFGEAAYTDGYSVTLTVDSEKQKAATETLRAGLENYDRRHGFRGAIGQFDVTGVSATQLSDQMLNYPRVESLIPAVITEINDEQGEAQVHTRHLGPGKMSFDSMSWAKRYRTESLTGPAPSKVSDVVSVGDVVYVKALQLPQIREQNDDQENTGDILKQELQVALSQAPRVEGAVISINAQSGAIEALSGGYSFSQSKYNRATQANRQPGSTFKPFLYLAALESGRTPATMYNDAPIVFEDSELEGAWRPQNSSGQFYGPTTLREGLYRSRNLVSIRLLRDIGIRQTLDYLDQLKIPTARMPDNLSLSLGSGQLTPMDLARGFAVVANGGYDTEPYLIQRIQEPDGTVVYEAPETVLCESNCDEELEKDGTEGSITTDQPDTPETEGMKLLASAETTPERRVMQRLADERSVYILHSIMQDVVRRGTGRRALALNRNDLAGKTGTTNDQIDTWFAGFNHNIATTVWVGFDQPAPLGRGEFGASTALPIWVDYMQVAMKDAPSANMPRPNGIANIRINPKTGERARPGEDGSFELFKEEEAPAPLPQDSNENGGNGDGNRLPGNIF